MGGVLKLGFYYFGGIKFWIRPRYDSGSFVILISIYWLLRDPDIYSYDMRWLYVLLTQNNLPKIHH